MSSHDLDQRAWTSHLDHLSPIPDYHGRGVTEASFAAMLRDVQNVFEERIGLASVGRILASDEVGPREWRDRVVTPRLHAIGEYFAHGVQNGALNPDINYEMIIEMVLGGMIIRDAVAGDVPDNWANDIVHTLWPLVRRP